MNSATACLHAAGIAAGIGPGDEVIVTPYSFASSATCVAMCGGTPVFVDVTPDTFCLDPEKVEQAITSQTKAIIPVHLCGHPAEMVELLRIADEHELVIIEDAAQAIGATYGGRLAGTIGHCGIFSFNQSKQVSSGEGGILVTSSPKVARIARAVRNHAEVSDPELGIMGYNYRMCEVEAAIVLDQFKDLDRMLDTREFLTTLMSKQLEEIDCGITPPVVKPDCKHAWYTYAMKVDKEKLGMHRDQFQDEMQKRGVYFGRGYVKPLYRLPFFQKVGKKTQPCPVVEGLYGEKLMVTDIFKFPMTLRDVNRIADVVRSVVSASRKVHCGAGR